MSFSYLVDGQFIRVPLGNPLRGNVHHGDLDVGALEGHHTARGSSHIASSYAANLGDHRSGRKGDSRLQLEYVDTS